MASVPTGTTFHIASAFGSALTTSAASNAAECVLSMASTTGLANGDFVEVTSGWGRLNKRAARIKSVVLNTSITLEGIDTSSTTYFTAGAGTGSVRKVTTFTQITQVTAVSSSGGDPVTVDYKYIESDVRYSINDGFNATSYTLTLDADSIATAGYIALKALTDVQTDTILRINKRSGAINLVPCTCALNESDSMNDGQITTVTASFNGNNRATKYSA
ncbi:MAG: phage tail tube protein [Roseateles sp.]|uniref:phage tail tube protein n=1 Tax=Roseateles sp. TaxID=1971397 RepID=UPI004036C71E